MLRKDGHKTIVVVVGFVIAVGAIAVIQCVAIIQCGQFSLEFIVRWRTSEFSGGSFHPKENVDHPKPTSEMVAQLGPFKVPGITEHLDYIKGTLVDHMDVLCSYAGYSCYCSICCGELL